MGGDEGQLGSRYTTTERILGVGLRGNKTSLLPSSPAGFILNRVTISDAVTFVPVPCARL